MTEPNKKPRKRRSDARVTVDQVAQAIRETNGLLTVAAKRLGVTRGRVSQYIMETETCAEAASSAIEGVKDLAEAKLYNAVNNGAAWAICFFLKCRAKDRGYIERVEYDPARMSDEDLTIIREGMRLSVLEGTAKGLNMPGVDIAAKTGTAELGETKERVNSWVIGFFPYESPRYAFAVVMEQGPATNLIGSLFVMRRTFDWMVQNAPEYLTTP